MNLVTKKLSNNRKVVLAVSLLSLVAIPLAACSGATAGQSPLLPTEPEAAVSPSVESGEPGEEPLAAAAPEPEPPSPPAETLITAPTIIAEPVSFPTDFEVTDLVINPAEIQPGGQIIITAKLTNGGDGEGSDEIELKINGVTQVVKEVTLPAGVTQELSFSGYMMPEAEPGTYTVDLGELTAQFEVSEPAETLILSSPDPEASVPSQSSSGGCGGCGSSGSGSGCGCSGSTNTTSSRGGCGGCGG